MTRGGRGGGRLADCSNAKAVELELPRPPPPLFFFIPHIHTFAQLPSLSYLLPAYTPPPQKKKKKKKKTTHTHTNLRRGVL